MVPIKTETFVAVFYIVLVATLNATPLNDEKAQNDLLTRIMGEIPDAARNELEKVEKARMQCPYGTYYSFSTRYCEPCDSHCPDGKDITLCGRECRYYFLEKNLTSSQQNLSEKISENRDDLKILEEEDSLISKQVEKQKRELTEKDNEISELQIEIKDLSSEIKEVEQKDETLLIIFGGIIAAIFLFYIIYIIGKHVVKKGSHSKYHKQKTRGLVESTSTIASATSQPAIIQETVPLQIFDGDMRERSGPRVEEPRAFQATAE